MEHALTLTRTRARTRTRTRTRTLTPQPYPRTQTQPQPGKMLVMEVDEEDWELGYDAVDGGSTASVAAILDGKTLVYAAVRRRVL